MILRPESPSKRLLLVSSSKVYGSGYLDRYELSNVLKASNLNLTERQVRQVLAEADENDDNVIQYREFLPLMVDMLQSIKASFGKHRHGAHATALLGKRCRQPAAGPAVAFPRRPRSRLRP